MKARKLTVRAISYLVDKNVEEEKEVRECDMESCGEVETA